MSIKTTSFPLVLTSDSGSTSDTASEFTVPLDQPLHLDPDTEWKIGLKEVLVPQQVKALPETITMKLCGYVAYTTQAYRCGGEASKAIPLADMANVDKLLTLLETTTAKLPVWKYCILTLVDKGNKGDKCFRVKYTVDSHLVSKEPSWPYLDINDTLQRILGADSSVCSLAHEPSPAGWHTPVIRLVIYPQAKHQNPSKEYLYKMNKTLTDARTDGAQVLDITVPATGYTGVI